MSSFGSDSKDEKFNEHVNSTMDTESGIFTSSHHRRSRALEVVGNLFSGIRDSMSIPRAVIRGQTHDRQPFNAPHNQLYLPTTRDDGIHILRSVCTSQTDRYTTGTCCSMYKGDRSGGSDSIYSRIGSFLEELSSLPWISDRVVDDYIPGQSRRVSGGSQAKHSTPWYTVPPPSSPSEISDRAAKLPEPFLGRQEPPTSQMAPGSADPVEHTTGEIDRDKEKTGEKDETEKLREEVEAQTRRADELQQKIAYLNERIAVLEETLEKKEEVPTTLDAWDRRTSMRLHSKRASTKTVVSVKTSSRRGSLLLS